MSWSNRVQEVVNQREAANEPVWRAIHAVKKDANLDPEQRNRYLAQLYGSLSDKDVTQSLNPDAVKFGVGISFRSHINDLRRVKSRMKKRGVNLFPGGNPKIKDRAFASALGVQVPKTYQANVRFKDISLVPNSVLKPVAGSSALGVFIINGQRHLQSVRTGETYKSLEDAWNEIVKYRDRISADQWILEELVLSKTGKPANDLKVYAFYGVAGMYLEIDRYTDSAVRHATYYESGERFERGSRHKTFNGTGVPQDAITVVKKLSLAAPVPFLRLDFHYGADGLYLGEITPHPGGTYAGDHSEHVDRMLGHYFADAKARLYIDLLNGKRFPEFYKAYEIKRPLLPRFRKTVSRLRRGIGL